MDQLSILLLPGGVLLLTLAAGFWVSGVGKPYHPLGFTLHKLAALAAVTLFSIRFVSLERAAAVNPLRGGLLIAAAVCALGLFASGALMSVGKFNQLRLLRVHQALPVLGAAALVAAWLLL